jgi:cobalamin biosynthesis Mg chelatase CobN
MPAETSPGTASGPHREEAPLPRSAAALEREIEARRTQLAATIDELATRAKPKEIARRGAAGVTARAQAAISTSDGHLRTERVAAVAGAAVVVLVAVVWLRRRR